MGEYICMKVLHRSKHNDALNCRCSYFLRSIEMDLAYSLIEAIILDIDANFTSLNLFQKYTHMNLSFYLYDDNSLCRIDLNRVMINVTLLLFFTGMNDTVVIVSFLVAESMINTTLT